MASPFINIFFFSFLITHFYTDICDNGWIVPKHDYQTYNNWASTNVQERLGIGGVRQMPDLTSSILRSNNGDTVYKLDRPGSIYFISWATGYYQRGQEMLMVIMAVPKHDNRYRTYNNWASTNRFIVNDTIQFTYKKESVLVEYDKCQTSHPQFFSNNSDTDYKLDQPGLTGHCQRGQKMVVKVLGLPPENPAQASHRECDKQWCSL
ncbi:Plastocyanin-like protein [Gossypium australe]|uniref:Plastocyanin-like protein n=1 Tax=Gossypium australe TaxID=47621 RepID=A0A5B6W3D3_9ROSI|nr:Plastocyanin-like protein [Gossypium australe]